MACEVTLPHSCVHLHAGYLYTVHGYSSAQTCTQIQMKHHLKRCLCGVLGCILHREGGTAVILKPIFNFKGVYFLS